MVDARPPEARLARLESCTARLEERINAIAEGQKEWKAETLRRLAENNENAKKLMEERARDRAELVTLDVYNSRHQELKTLAESAYREMNQKIDTLALRVDQKMTEHDRDDARTHKDTNDRLDKISEEHIGPLEQFKSNIQGRMTATATIAAALSALLTAVVVQIIHIISK